jgi:uncharacterized membrane protein YvbJ
MKTCPECGHAREDGALTCPECGRFYSKIIELIEQEAEREFSQSWRGKWQRFMQAQNKQQAFYEQWRDFKAGLPLTARFTLVLIALFVFALIVTVL